MGEKDLGSRLLALSPDAPLAPDDARALVRDALLAAPSGAAGGVPPRSALRGRFVRLGRSTGCTSGTGRCSRGRALRPRREGTSSSW